MHTDPFGTRRCSSPWPSLLLAAALFIGSGSSAWAEPATIELADGSTLRGEVLSLKVGAYEIATTSLGVIRVPQQDVVLVSYQPSAQAGAVSEPQGASATNTAALADVQQRLAANPQTLSMIMRLSDDAEVQAIIRDPAIQAAISSGDFESLMANPKIKTLMRHPTIRKITADSQ